MQIQVVHYMRRPRTNVFSIERLYEDVRANLPTNCRVETWICTEPSHGIMPRLRDMWRARSHQREVNHVTGDVHYLTFLLSRRRTVLTINDLVLLEQFTGIKRWLIWFFWYWLPVHRSNVIITISNATRDALLQSVRCKSSKIRVITCPVSVEFQFTPKLFNSERPIILQVGTTPNKNVERVADALADISAKLVVVGPLSEAQKSALRRNNIDYENHVGLTRAELLGQYVRADLVTFASTYEGFGLPIIEAQAVGRPVITSGFAPMTEVGGDAACFVDPFDPLSIRTGIQKVIDDEGYRNELVERGKANVSRFSSESSAAEYAKIYHEVAHGNI